ncbi:hypothetical protein DOY81_000975 [Sarcophaga bullata]|nr:hypothetical protein DOY81_000975 [Sarcophaga bullata]
MSYSTKQRNGEPKEILGLNRITKKRILELCKKNKLYQTPELNDVLYLHYQGFECIECLEDYTELKCLWLECNAISEIQGLDKQTKLKCLFLQSNLIRKIENLDFCKELDMINLSQNHIRKIENCGFEVLPVLNTLNLASNYITNCEGLRELENCRNLSVLDLSNNRIDDILVVKIFAKMPELKVLVLQGNPVVSKIPQYRKTLILECKKLTYLDSRPVFPKDRACAEAWKRGGYQEERKENERWNRKERKKMRDGVNATIKLRNKYRKAEDQLSLIPSSDSEEDSSAPKQIKSVREYEDVSIDSMWDEVANDRTSEKSGMSTSTSTSTSDGTDPDQISEESDEPNELKNEIVEDVTPANELENPNIKSVAPINETNKAEVHGSQTSLDSEDMQEKYQPTVEAIRSLSKSEHSIIESWSKVEFDIENVLKDNEDNYEPLEELEETMKLLNQLENKHLSSQVHTQLKGNKMSLESQHKEIDSCQINYQLKKDFEELSVNMENFVKQLDKEKEERKEIIDALFSTQHQQQQQQQQQQQNIEDSSSDTNDQEMMDDDINEKKWNSLVDQWDKATKLPNKPINLVNEVLIKDIKDIENPPLSSLEPNEPDSSFSCVVINQENKKETNLSENSLYEPLDITFMSRQSREAMNSFEREANELKKLLQKLETENEVLFNDINTESKCQMEDQIQENKEKEHEEVNREIVSPLLNEILQSLELINLCPPSYKFPEIFSDTEDNNYCEPIRPPTNPTHSDNIPQFRAKFKEFFQDVKNKNQKELTKVQQKTLVFKQMSEQPALNRFHHESLDSVNAQLEEFKRQQKAKISRLVDRVYAQKDRYNDTLELSDGKLMVRNRDTGELKDLPEPTKHDSTDSESDYDTALSDDETEKPKFLHSWRKPFKPTVRKSSEYLITQALNENNCFTARDQEEESEDSNDEFYSIESQNKPSLYSIDREFFNKLTLENLDVSETDENHIVHCARSYEELKNCLKLSKEERSLTAEETELLESMIEKKGPSNTNQPDRGETKPLSGKLTEEEQAWFDKMLQKTKDEQKDVYIQTLAIPAGIKLYEYKYDNENVSCGSSRDWPARDRDTATVCNEIHDKGIYTFVYEGPEEDTTKDETIENQRELEEEGIGKEKSSMLSMEFPSEEEKAEIESNIDNENKCAGKKITTTTEIAGLNTSCPVQISDTKTCSKSSPEIEVLECNLEIIDCNEEVVDTITVSAEVHY